MPIRLYLVPDTFSPLVGVAETNGQPVLPPVGSTGMPAGVRPFRSAVANEMYAWKKTRLIGHGWAPHCQFRISGMSWP